MRSGSAMRKPLFCAFQSDLLWEKKGRFFFGAALKILVFGKQHAINAIKICLSFMEKAIVTKKREVHFCESQQKLTMLTFLLAKSTNNAIL